MPEQLSHRKIYEPGKNVRENEIRNYLKRCWNDKYNY